MVVLMYAEHEMNMNFYHRHLISQISILLSRSGGDMGT